MTELIAAKREGKALTQEQLFWTIDSYKIGRASCRERV
jgi:thymidine phosphorylase